MQCWWYGTCCTTVAPPSICKRSKVTLPREPTRFGAGDTSGMLAMKYYWRAWYNKNDIIQRPSLCKCWWYSLPPLHSQQKVNGLDDKFDTSSTNTFDAGYTSGKLGIEAWKNVTKIKYRHLAVVAWKCWWYLYNLARYKLTIVPLPTEYKRSRRELRIEPLIRVQQSLIYCVNFPTQVSRGLTCLGLRSRFGDILLGIRLSYSFMCSAILKGLT